ncbi:MAG TPA: methyl-accepting chemotaxis protein [Candidatus Baltobacteraceae bacterium]|nr:methyl-accepting chemotaxis protein [Candidatus Baltobacteraceae bacterium]
METSTTIGKKLFLAFLVVIVATGVLPSLFSMVFRLAVPQKYYIPLEYVLIFTGILGVVIGMILAFFMAKGFTTELRGLAGAARVVAEGDLTQDVPVNTRDEVGEVAESFNQMVGSLREIVREVKTTSEAVTGSAVSLSSSAEEMNSSTEEIAATVEQIAKGAEHQASLVDETSKVIHGMAGAITEIASRAKAAAEAAAEAGYTAQTGGKSARDAMEKMKGVFTIVEGAAGGVKGLSSKTQQVGTIVDVITRIAQQTNLLALNATIEAARAGEAGRGFAVVADEVRKLATEAAGSAEKIAEIIKEVQSESIRVADSMDMATREIASGRDVLTYTSTALEEIVRGVVDEVKKVQEISGLTQRQTEGAQSLVKTIDEIAKVAEDNAASTEEASAATTEQTASMDQMAQSAQQLSGLADKLKSLVARFNVGA